MRFRPFFALLVACLLGLLAAVPVSAQNLVGLTPSQVGGDAGATVLLDLTVDFADPALGGGIVVDFDAAHLAFDDFTFDATSPDDPALRLVCPSAAPACDGFPGPGVLVAFAVDTIGFPAINGAHTIGRLRFDVLATTTSSLTLREDDSVAGPLVGVGPFAAPTLSGAQVVPGGAPAVPSIGGPGLGALAVLLVGTGRLLVRGRRARPRHPGGLA